MSVSVYLDGDTATEKCTCPHCGNQHTRQVTKELFSTYITHNLGEMANAAGIYGIVWHPENFGISSARQMIAPLERGVAMLRADPTRFKAFNSKNGLGTYDDFVLWLEKYLHACKKNPEAKVRTR